MPLTLVTGSPFAGKDAWIASQIEAGYVQHEAHAVRYAHPGPRPCCSRSASADSGYADDRVGYQPDRE